MVALAPSQIPASASASVERLAAWAGLLLHRLNGTQKCLETPNFSDYTCQASIFQADDGTQRLVIRLNLELEQGFAESDTKLWEQVKKFVDATIPTPYTS